MKRHVQAATVVAVWTAAMAARAQSNYTWTGGASPDGNWSAAANWGGTGPTSLQAILTFDGATGLAATNDFGAGSTGYRVLFAAGADGFTLSGNAILFSDFSTAVPLIRNSSATGQTVSLDILHGNATGNGEMEVEAAAGSLAFHGAVTASGGPRDLILKGGFDLTLTGALGDGDGALAVRKQGAGTATLAGTNTYSAGTTIDGGVLSVEAIDDAGTSGLGNSGDLTLNGGTLRYTGAGAASSARNLWLNLGPAAFDLANAAGALTLSPAGGTVDQAVTKGGPGALTLNGIIGGSAAVTNLAGTLTLGGNNTFTNGTVVEGGTVVLAHAVALGGGAATVQTGGVLNANGQAIANPVTLDGGRLRAGANGLTISSPITLGTGGGILQGGPGDYATFSGPLSGGVSGTVALAVRDGHVSLSNSANDFLGEVDVKTAWYLRTTASEAIPDTAVINIGTAGGEYKMFGAGLTETVAGLSGGTTSNYGIFAEGGANTLRVGAGDWSGTFSGPFRQVATLDVEKIGTGTWELLSTASAAAGLTTVHGGTLKLNGAGMGFDRGYFSGSRGMLVNTGATLEVANTWNIGSANLVTADQARIRITVAGTDGPNYLNHLTLRGSTVFGNPFRAGNLSDAEVVVAGDLPSAISNTLILVNDVSVTGARKITFDVADGAAATDLDVAGLVTDLGVIGTPARFGTDVIKAGAGTLRLGAANSYSGDTVVRAGTVLAGGNGALGAGTNYLNDALTDTNNVTLLMSAPVTLNNTIVVGGSSGVTTIGTASYTTDADSHFGGAVILGRGVVLQAGSSDRTTFGGLISGTGNVTVVSPVAGGRRIAIDRPTGATNDFIGDVTIGTNATLQIGVGNSIGNRTIPDASTIYFADGNSKLRPAPTGSGDSETVGTLVSLAASAGVVDMFTGTGFTLVLGADGESGVFSGAIINSAGALAVTKAGGGTQTLSGANGYRGVTTGSAGTLIGARTAVFGTNALVLGDAATGAADVEVLLANSADIANAITVASNGSGAAVIGTSGPGLPVDTTLISGPVTLQRPTTFRSTVTDRLAFSQRITGPVGLLTVTGGGRVTLENAANDFVGDILVAGAGSILQSSVVGAGEIIPNASRVDVATGAVFQVAAAGGAAETINALTGAGTVRRYPGLGGAQTLAVGGAGGSGEFAGVIENGTGNSVAFAKVGSGTQVLSGANTFTGGTAVNGGALVVAAIADAGLSHLGPSGTLSFDGGALIYTATGAVESTARAVALNAGGGTIEIADPGSSLDLAGALSGSGALTKAGPGALVLAGSGTNEGPVTAAAGLLRIDGNFSGATGAVMVAAGGTLGGTGTLGGAVTVQAGGALAPGTGVGTLTSGPVALDAGSRTVIELDTDYFTNDVLAAPSITYGGTLVLTNVAASTLDAGMRFGLFSAGTYVGVFAAVEPPAPGPGLAWDTSALPSNGTVAVVSSVAGTNPVVTGFARVGTSNLVLVVNTMSGVNYVLESATNLLPPAIWEPRGTNAGTGGPVTNVIPVNPARAREFIRYLTP